MMQASHSYSEVATRFQSCSTGEVVLHNLSINLIPNLALRLLVIGVLGGDPKLLPKSHLKSRCIFFLLDLIVERLSQVSPPKVKAVLFFLT